jgi:protein O-mannosyl-transferase
MIIPDKDSPGNSVFPVFVSRPIPSSLPIGLLVILVITTAVFSLSLVNGFVWDDGELVVLNEAYLRFDLRGMIFGQANSLEYLPVRDISVAIDAQIWGMRPFGFHLTNLLLYLAGLAALHAMIRQLAGQFALEHERPLAFWTTLIFALHPLHVEAVNFITARNTLLAGLFLFLSMVFLVRGLREKRHILTGFSLLFYLLAVFSKAIAVFFPVFLLVLFVIMPRDMVSVRRKTSIFTAFAVLTAAAVWVHASNAVDSGLMNDEILRFGTGNRWLALAKSVQIPFFYLRMLLVPYPLTVEYSTAFLSGPLFVRTALGATVLIAVLAGAWLLRKRAPMVTIGVAWLITSLGPVLNLFPTHPVVADRYAYLAVAGFGLIFAHVLTLPGAGRKAVLVPTCTVLVLWSGVDISRSLDWRSDMTLWSSAIAADADASRANLALTLWKEGRYDEALSQLREDRRRKGTHYASLYEGLLLMQNGMIDEAIKSFHRSLTEGGEAYREVRVNLAEAYEKKGDPSKALEQYLKALESKNIDVYGRYEKKAREGAERIRAQYAPLLQSRRKRAGERPGDPDAQTEAALTLHSLGYYDEAEQYYRVALDLDPGRWDVWYNLGLTYMRRKQSGEAVKAFEAALTLNPGTANILNNLGICFVQLKDFRRAEQSYRHALELEPGFFYAVFNLGRLYFLTGDAIRARELFDRARAMAEGDPALQGRVDQYLGQLRKG